MKLANKLFRTNSPGLLSGSTLTGAMTTGPFLSPNVPLTGGRGGFSPTGEAVESQDRSVSFVTHIILYRAQFWNYSSHNLGDTADVKWKSNVAMDSVS